MERIDYVTERVWEWGERQTYNPTNYKEKKRKKRAGCSESVELMDNVSPLWCWKAGRMSL